jgi:hypothetical protein
MRDTLREIWVTPNAPVESKTSAATICPQITKEKTVATPNFGIELRTPQGSMLQKPHRTRPIVEEN